MFPQLNTRRLLLQQFLPEDQQFVFEALSHPEVVPYYGVRYASFEDTGRQMEFYRDLEANSTGTWWKLVDRATNAGVGAIGYNNYQSQHHKAEIGYWLLPRFRGSGLVQEALEAVIHYLFFTKGLHRLEALIETENGSSARVVERAGFVLEGTLRECEMKNGRYISLWLYSLLPGDIKKAL